MSGSSVTNTIKAVNDIVVTSITNVLQQVSSTLTASQFLEFGCEKAVLDDLSLAEDSCWKETLPELKSGKWKASDVNDLCSPVICTGENISMSGSIRMDAVTHMVEETQTKISDEIANNIRALSLQKSSSPLSTSDSTTNIRSLVNQTVNLLTTLTDKQTKDLVKRQEIVVNGVSIQNLDQSSVTKVISNTLQSNKAYQSAVTKVANDLDSTLKDVEGGGLSQTFWEIIAVIGLLLVIGLIVWLVRRFRKRKQLLNHLNYKVTH